MTAAERSVTEAAAVAGSAVAANERRAREPDIRAGIGGADDASETEILHLRIATRVKEYIVAEYDAAVCHLETPAGGHIIYGGAGGGDLKSVDEDERADVGAKTPVRARA